jgi:NAD(P)-dependent dehydrogenase (short-subunit alcohol dehydrogenase family)
MYVLAERVAKIAVHYYQNRDAAEKTLAEIRDLGSSGFIVQADCCRPEEVSRIFEHVGSEFGALDIFVSNARTEAASFYQPPMDCCARKRLTGLLDS